MRSRSLALLAAQLLAISSVCHGETQVKILDKWSAIFGNQPTVYNLSVNSPVNTRGRLMWHLSVNGATIVRGESLVTPKVADPARVAITLKGPALKHGVCMEALLSASFVKEAALQASASVEKKIWIFASDPFVSRQHWLIRQRIRLFDPGETTALVLKEAGVPFTLVPNIESLAEGDGIVIIGEGVSFRDYRGLPPLMMKAAERGIGILCLAPTGGEFEIPGDGNPHGLRDPDAMEFRPATSIRKLDKRLDAVAWPRDGVVVVSSMKLVGQRGPVVGEVVAGDEGWPWVKMDYEGAGTVMIVGFPIMAKWQSGPTPRYLLARLLEVLTDRGGDG